MATEAEQLFVRRFQHLLAAASTGGGWKTLKDRPAIQTRHRPAASSGPSHIDTFDPKPALDCWHLERFVRKGAEKEAMESGSRYSVKGRATFRKAGEGGADIAENWEQFAGETARTLDDYGIGREPTDSFGRKLPAGPQVR